MAAHVSEVIHGRIYTVTEHPVKRSAETRYTEYRLEERRGDGSFVAYHAFGSLEFVRAAFDAIPRETAVGNSVPCRQCGQLMNPAQVMLGPVCGDCCRQNHRKVAQ